MEARSWVKKYDGCEEEKEDDSAQINNLVKSSFLKIFDLMYLT
jgi:hypothetical protein